MALRFNFKRGTQQSMEASHYFMMLGTDLLTSYLPPLEPKQLLFTEPGHEPLPMRIWCAEGLAHDRVQELLPWVRSLSTSLDTLSRRPGHEEDVVPLIKEWMDARHAKDTFFIEVLNPAHAFSPDEDNEMSIGVVAGETVMLSARNVMYVKLEPGLYGLSVARVGSYLVEHIAGEEQVMFLRRA